MSEHIEDTDLTDAIASVESELGTLWRRIRSTWTTSATLVHPSLQPVGYKILSTLVQHGQAPVSSLVEHVAVDKSVMSRQLRFLEEHELVTIEADPNDGRARIVRPTERAIERVSTVRARNQRILHEQLSDWSPEELRLFARLLGQVGEVAERARLAD